MLDTAPIYMDTSHAASESRALSLQNCLAAFALWVLANGIPVGLCLGRFIHPDWAVRLIYDGNTLLLPAVFLVATAWALRSAASRRTAAAFLLAASLLASVRVYATHIEPANLQVRELTLPIHGLSHAITLLHLSDIQSGAVGGYEARIFEKIRELDPDLIVHTGDLLQPRGNRTLESEVPRLAALFATLNPPMGMYAVEGESDTRLKSLSPDRLGGLRFLNAGSVTIRGGDVAIRLLGLTLAQSADRSKRTLPAVESWLNGGPEGAINLVMGHRPEYFMRLAGLPIDLCLAGHTHGGQIQLPWLGALTTASSAPRDWARGLFEVGQTRLNVSAGIGASHNKGLPSIRINCPPEMTLIRFVPAPPSPPTR